MKHKRHTNHSASAVEVAHVTKAFTQSQRENIGDGVLRNLFKPQKRTIYALDDVSFTVGCGEFVAYAGPNGAGKSTTMKLLCGMLLPMRGDIAVLGHSPKHDRIPLMRRLGVLFGNRTELWWDHPISQSFEWKQAVWDIPDDAYRRNLDYVTELLDIGPLLKTFARELSLGQRMRADLAMMLLHSPELILLDEPTLGLDVVAKRQMIDFLKRLNADSGVTIVVTSHDMDDLEEMARRILMLSDGCIMFDGSFDDLRAVTGSPSRITVTLGDHDDAPELPYATLLSDQEGVCEYEADLSRVPVGTLLHAIAAIDGVRDVEINKADIEHVIAQLYKSWKQKGQEE